MDQIQPTAAQSYQNRGPLVLIEPPPTQIPTGQIQVGNTSVLLVSQVRDLGVYLDTDVAMRAHITATLRKCFTALQQICSVRRSVPRHALLTLIWSLVVSSIDYCNPVLVGVSGHLLNWLQSVLNTAA